MSVEHQLSPLKADAIAALLTKEIKPVFFLGAGASFKSGIPLAGMLIDAIARFAYCKAHNRNPDDPTLMRSDWIRWLEQQAWFRTDMPPADLYPSAVEYLLRPQSNRKEFFQRILRPDVPVSEGYKRLASLLARRAVRTVLTTSFDDLVVRTAKQTPAVHYVEEIFTPSDHALFRTNPPHPQVVYLHGSVNHYTDRNLVRETQELDTALVSLLRVFDRVESAAGLRVAPTSILPSASHNSVGTPDDLISRLNGWPAASPVNASAAPSRVRPHDSGPGWIATPFLCRTFIDYSLTVSLSHYASGEPILNRVDSA